MHRPPEGTKFTLWAQHYRDRAKVLRQQSNACLLEAESCCRLAQAFDREAQIAAQETVLISGIEMPIDCAESQPPKEIAPC